MINDTRKTVYCILVGLSSLLRKTYGDRWPKLQTEANCEILVKCDFG